MPDQDPACPDWMPTRYRIAVQGSLSDDLVSLLEPVCVEDTGSSTVLDCEIVDQARLHAALGWLHREGLEVLSVEAVADPTGRRPAG